MKSCVWHTLTHTHSGCIWVCLHTHSNWWSVNKKWNCYTIEEQSTKTRVCPSLTHSPVSPLDLVFVIRLITFHLIYLIIFAIVDVWQAYARARTHLFKLICTQKVINERLYRDMTIVNLNAPTCTPFTYILVHSYTATAKLKAKPKRANVCGRAHANEREWNALCNYLLFGYLSDVSLLRPMQNETCSNILSMDSGFVG